MQTRNIRNLLALAAALVSAERKAGQKGAAISTCTASPSKKVPSRR